MSVFIGTCTCSVLLLLFAAQLHCAFPDCPDPGVYIPHINGSGHLIKCKPINCHPDYEVEICTTECESDWCRPCKRGKTQPLQTNSSFATKSRCIEEARCSEDLEHVPDNRLRCRCSLSKGYYGNDPTNCMFREPQCEKGTELIISGACRSCTPGTFKEEDGPALCSRQRGCKTEGFYLIRKGNATHDSECGNKTDIDILSGGGTSDSATKIILPTSPRPVKTTDDTASSNSWVIPVVVVAIVIGIIAFGIIVLCKRKLLTPAKLKGAVTCCVKSQLPRSDNDIELAEMVALHPERASQDPTEEDDTPTAQLDNDSVECTEGHPTKLVVPLPKLVAVIPHQQNVDYSAKHEYSHHAIQHQSEECRPADISNMDHASFPLEYVGDNGMMSFADHTTDSPSHSSSQQLHTSSGEGHGKTDGHDTELKKL